MTADEVSFAGGVYNTKAETWYYKNSAIAGKIQKSNKTLAEEARKRQSRAGAAGPKSAFKTCQRTPERKKERKKTKKELAKTTADVV